MATTVSVTQDLSTTPEQTYQVMGDPQQFSSWIVIHDGFVGEPPSALMPGGSFTQRLRVLGMPVDVKWTIDALDAPRALVMKGNGPMGIALKATFTIESTGDGSRAGMAFAFSGVAVMAVGGQLKAELTPALEESLGKLKALLDS